MGEEWGKFLCASWPGAHIPRRDGPCGAGEGLAAIVQKGLQPHSIEVRARGHYRGDHDATPQLAAGLQREHEPAVTVILVQQRDAHNSPLEKEVGVVVGTVDGMPFGNVAPFDERFPQLLQRVLNGDLHFHLNVHGSSSLGYRPSFLPTQALFRMEK